MKTADNEIRFFQRVTALSLAIPILFLAGCQLLSRNTVEVVQVYSTDQPVDFFLSPQFNRLRPGRIVLMVPEMRDNSYEIQSRFAESIGNSLTQFGVFEVVVVAGRCGIDMNTIRNGTFDERALLDITRQHNADGILFCEVTNFSAYEPLQLGCALTFVDTRESIVTLHTNGVWNSTEEKVMAKFLQDVCRIHRCKKYAAGVYLKSPTEYMDFVARDLAAYLQNLIYRGLGQTGNNGFNEFDYR